MKEKLSGFEKLDRLLSSEKRIFFVDDLADYTGFSKSTIYHLVQQRKIPYSRPNGKVLTFERSLIDAWLLSNPVTPDNADQQAEYYVANNPLKGDSK